ncbi:MAG: Thioredoxin [Lacunisphaera sp.]|nr:Thioredoxin [Lacunisphaera sp.]
MKKTNPRWLMLGFFTLGLLSGRAATLDEAIADSQLWPAEVTVTVMTKAGVVKNGQVSGMMLVGAGKKLAVSGLAADGVTGKVGGTTVKVPIDKTDLLQRLGSDGPAAAAAPPPEARAQKSEVSAKPGPEPTPVAAETPPAHVPPSNIERSLFGKLVQLDHGALKPFDVRKLNGVKYYGLMFSAGWCGPCRAFAPTLLDNYRKLRAQYPEFELVLVSNDHSEGAMLDYMREENMPWPAVKYSAIRDLEQITALCGPGIPCLVLIDGNGKVLADSFKGSDYLGPGSVLEATWRVLQKNHANPPKASNQ